MTKSERKKKWRREHLKEVAAYAKKYRAVVPGGSIWYTEE